MNFNIIKLINNNYNKLKYIYNIKNIDILKINYKNKFYNKFLKVMKKYILQLKRKYKSIFGKPNYRHREIKYAFKRIFDGEYDYNHYSGEDGYHIDPLIPDCKTHQLGLTKISIKETKTQITLSIYTARPGLLIGKGGKNYDIIIDEMGKCFNKNIKLNIYEKSIWN